MLPHVEHAIRQWQQQFEDLQTAAADVMQIAFPPLEVMQSPTGCCDTRLHWQDEDSNASGYVCIDDFMQATLQFENLPHAVAGQALDEVFGLGWFDGAEQGVSEAGEGVYYWTDETNAAEWEVTVLPGGLANLSIEYTNAADIATLLDALHTAYEEHDQDQTDTAT
ncbi:hypothetical protein GTY75_09010 [Streptomyces sp. SID8381]|uniref:hypothetical protein n=1 Tax=unclassified Streptomyces TaxID=2593676 RepID=UPI0003785405|nr:MULTISPECIES: hypothetical protein [unclassified Streptomyces]MYX26806.1 hypothetical protein [Streptomyces sp. SID8381]